MKYLYCFFTILFSALFVHADSPKFPDPLPVHPRLYLTKQREQAIRDLIEKDDFLKKQVSELILKADKALSEPVTDYKIPDGKRLLGQSRRSLDRTSALAFAYRMTGNEKYAESALAEMLAVCRFKDWNPSHFLDTAEMALAVAIGYDWMYDYIPDESKKEISAAVLKLALEPGLKVFEKGGWWTKAHNNWNEVCNAGLLAAAAAMAEEYPETAQKILEHTLKSFPNGLKAYAPDGAYPEGPIYWAYGATFSGVMIHTLIDLFGQDFGFLKSQGFDRTGTFYKDMCGPLYRSFNYADAGDGVDPTPMMYALSHWFDRPDYADWLRTFQQNRHRYQNGRFAVFHAVWYQPKTASKKQRQSTPKAGCYHGIQDVMTMRTQWDEPNAAFVGFKAGNNRANHGHLDIGSFVYDVNGQRWVADLGADNYNMPGYFGKNRWNYFRMNNRSHNTLVIGDQLQNIDANCKLGDFKLEAEKDQIASVVANMTDAYKGQAQSAKRRATLLKNKTLIIEDELHGVKEPVRWAILTHAQVSVEKKNATLKIKNETVKVFMESDQVKTFEILPATPPTEAENANKGITILAAFATPKEGSVFMKTVFKPEK